ncbi:MAG: hypothetical protein KA224_00865 [Steroidobacteraceae bacterium]|nr:hypothetical protein [Steroidobacteraceae bacterium]
MKPEQPGPPFDGRRRELLTLLGALLASGCTTLRPTVVTEPPPGIDTTGPAPPVIFIHGAFGAKLRRRSDGAEVFPGSVTDMLVSDYTELALPLDPATALPLLGDIEPFALFEEAAGVQFYGSVLRMLEQAGNYVPTEVGTPGKAGDRRQYVYLFDWRRDLVEAALGLDAFIERIRADHRDPRLKVDIVAHSAGGLVARYFLLYGGTPLADSGALRPTMKGAAKVRRLVTLGTPELGTARVAAACIHGEPMGLLGRVPPEVFATTPGALQLLPMGFDYWLVDEYGQPQPLSAHDVDTWRGLQIGLFSPVVARRVAAAGGEGQAGQDWLLLHQRGFELGLLRARRFTAALWAAALPASIRLHTIAGDCRPTQARLLLESRGGGPSVVAMPQDVRERRRGIDYEALMLEPGDGVVTQASALASPLQPSGKKAPRGFGTDIDSARFICAQHNQLAVNPQSQREVLRALGR